MSLKKQILDDIKTAMKQGEAQTRDTLRFLQSQIKNVEIDEGDLDDSGIQGVIRTQIKQIKDAMSDYEKAGVMDRLEEEAAKVEILEKYLPEQLSDAELEDLVAKVKEETGETEMGKLIGEVVSRAEGRAEGSRVAQAVRKYLS